MPFYAVYIPVKGIVGTSNSSNSGVNTSGTAVTGLVSTVTLPAAGSAVDNGENKSENTNYVFRKKCEALDILKVSKDARLREFVNEDDAIKYSQTGYEVLQTKYTDVRTPTATVEKAAFRTPTKQELIEFRKMIESGDYNRVKWTIWENPRYLVSSGDTPTTLKEGYRYNAMHVCSLSKHARIAELILQTVSDIKFADLLLGKKADTKTCKEMCMNLLDYYLNIPEKGRSETPLHLAVKFGALEVVEVLTSYAECKMTPNKEGCLPKDIICARLSNPNPELVHKIEVMLEERFYVPVIRSAHGVIPPQIGEPFSASNPPQLNVDPLMPEVKIEALAGPMTKEDAKKFQRRWKTPPRIGSNVSSPITSNPFISPMKSRTGCGNTTSLSTPISTINANNSMPSTPLANLQRHALFNSTPISSNCQQNKVESNEELPTELDEAVINEDKKNGNHHKGEQNNDNIQMVELDTAGSILIENNNNNNHDMNSHESNPSKMNTHTSTSMLKSVLDPRTPIQTKKKEIFSQYRDQCIDSPIVISSPYDRNDVNSSLVHDISMNATNTVGYKERHIKITDTEKGLEIIGRELAKEQNIGWREYWDFLNEFIDISSMEGLQRLENYFDQRYKEAEMSKKAAQAAANSIVILDSVCDALEKMNFAKDLKIGRNGYNLDNMRNSDYISSNMLNNMPSNNGDNLTNSTTQVTNPYTCVEKSVQVFAKRMTKTIIHNIDNMVSINDTLLSELKRLKSLICSFKEDTRFLNVNFAKVHSRIGNLISIYLQNSIEVTPAIQQKIIRIILKLLVTPGDRRDHIGCLCARILQLSQNKKEQTLPENLKTETMCSKAWSEENDCDCQWETNLSRKTSRRNRMEARIKCHQQNVKEKLKVSELEKDPIPIDDVKVNSQNDNDSSDELDDEIFWSDNGGSDTEDENDKWFTPPESPSVLSLIEEIENNDNNIYVCGTEPTKRDLDVLNAIFHVDIDKTKYPNVHLWRTRLLCFSNDARDYFPSPSVVRKGSLNLSNKENFNDTPIRQRTPYTMRQHSVSQNIQMKTSPTSSKYQQQQQQQPQHKQQLPLPIAKRLFSTPKLSKVTSTLPTNSDTNSTNGTVEATAAITETIAITPINITSTIPQRAQPFVTPLNKLRGLFTMHRGNSTDMMDSPNIGDNMLEYNNCSGDSPNLSLLNVSKDS